MGAASNFGRDEIGINSPTHRNTHAEEDLFSTNNILSANATNNKSDDLFEDIFKTCPTPSSPTTETVANTSNKSDDDFFNPRADEHQEFGDFASAFGGNAAAVAAAVAATTAPAHQSANAAETTKSEFADFNSAFDTMQQPTSTVTNDLTTDNSANLLFAVNSNPPSQQTLTSNSNKPVGDLLSDLDGLSLDVSAPSGKFSVAIQFY